MRLFSILLLSIVCLLVACTSSSLSTVTVSDSESTLCDTWSLSDTNAFCLPINDDSLLIQSNTNQVTATAYQMSIVIEGTAFIAISANIHVVSLEGQVFVGAQGQNRILTSGRDVNLLLIESVAQIPSETQILQSSLALDMTLLDNLPRAIDNTVLIVPSIPLATTRPTANQDICIVLATWTRGYSVERGDTLSGIARRFDLTVDELRQGNCLDNGSRITVGQILSVPNTGTSQENSQVTGFRADSYVLTSGICTILRWDAVNSVSILLNDIPVTQNNSLEVCPEETQTYTLSIRFADNSDVMDEITLTVQE